VWPSGTAAEQLTADVESFLDELIPAAKTPARALAAAS
jgi:hypothetical protein